MITISGFHEYCMLAAIHLSTAGSIRPVEENSLVSAAVNLFMPISDLYPTSPDNR